MSDNFWAWVAEIAPRRLVLACLYRVINHCRKFNDCRVGLTTISANTLLIEWRDVVDGYEREARA